MTESTPAPSPEELLAEALRVAFRRFGGIPAISRSEGGAEKIIKICIKETAALRTAAHRCDGGEVMSPFQRLVIRALGILIRMQMSPGREPGDTTVDQWMARSDALWKTETYPKIQEWEADAALALETDAEQEELRK